jgi:hypothetical protein
MGRMVSPRQQDRSFNYILQFPDITRPRVFGQRFHDLTVRAVSWNISQTGMLIEVVGLEAGNVVQLSFRLPPSRENIDASGVVVWVGDTRQIPLVTFSAQYVPVDARRSSRRSFRVFLFVDFTVKPSLSQPESLESRADRQARARRALTYF